MKPDPAPIIGPSELGPPGHWWQVGQPAAAVSWATSSYVGYEERLAVTTERRELARSGVALILAFGDSLEAAAGMGGTRRPLSAFVVGNQSAASLTGVRGHQLGVQIDLSLAGGRALFGDVGRLNDMVVPVDEALGRWGASLVDRLGEAADWSERFTLLDAALGEQLSDLREQARLTPEVHWIEDQLQRSGGSARVEPLMDETGWSRRVATQRFRTQTGLSPKAYARVVRFRRAAAMIDEDARPAFDRDAAPAPGPERTLAEVAIECGYYDQSHLTRDFTAMAGCSPAAYRAERQDRDVVRFVQDPDTVPALP